MSLKADDKLDINFTNGLSTTLDIPHDLHQMGNQQDIFTYFQQEKLKLL